MIVWSALLVLLATVAILAGLFRRSLVQLAGQIEEETRDREETIRRQIGITLGMPPVDDRIRELQKGLRELETVIFNSEPNGQGKLRQKSSILPLDKARKPPAKAQLTKEPARELARLAARSRQKPASKKPANGSREESRKPLIPQNHYLLIAERIKQAGPVGISAMSIRKDQTRPKADPKTVRETLAKLEQEGHAEKFIPRGKPGRPGEWWKWKGAQS